MEKKRPKRKRIVTYRLGEIGKVKVVEDFLPSPEKLASKNVRSRKPRGKC